LNCICYLKNFKFETLDIRYATIIWKYEFDENRLGAILKREDSSWGEMEDVRIKIQYWMMENIKKW
jgi:hypothetical protein